MILRREVALDGSEAPSLSRIDRPSQTSSVGGYVELDAVGYEVGGGGATAPVFSVSAEAGTPGEYEGEGVGPLLVGILVGSDVIGDEDGRGVGTSVVGDSVGTGVIGDNDGRCVGTGLVGNLVGNFVGLEVGRSLGPSVKSGSESATSAPAALLQI
mmetsp:Transcript_37211/g.81009  ORF Transcript_37211/g.81009 Transcript_37211/m.81009 type:complete len:156 (-) Transcript_37211:1108-1575(-)